MSATSIVFSLVCLLYFTVTHVADAQEKSTGSFSIVLPANRRVAPVLDSSLNVAGLSLAERNKLIEKLYEVDQLCRRPANNGRWTPGRKDARHDTNLMALNDPVNQALLLKILKLDGWPCDLSNGEKSRSYKAWFIVWHNRGSYEGMSRFYPYLKKANAQNCIYKTQFKEVSDVLSGVRAFRKGFMVTQ